MSIVSFDPTRDIFGMRNMGANMGQVNNPTPVDYSGLPLQGISPQEGLLNMKNAMGQDKYNNAPNMSIGTPQPWDWRYGGPPIGIEPMATTQPALERIKDSMHITYPDGYYKGKKVERQNMLRGLLEAYM